MRNFTAEAAALFDDSAMSELAKIIRIKVEDMSPAFQADLIETCAHYLAVVANLPCDLPGAPFDMSLTKRADWLEANVINPASRLLLAISDEKRPMFSTWPYPLAVPEFRDQSRLASELHALLSEANRLRDSLRGQQGEDAGHSQELRAEVFASIARLMRKHCPQVKPSRGVYDSEHQRRAGVYVDAIQLIYFKILGKKDNLDRLIRSEIHFPY